MASFDFIGASIKGYQFTWRARGYLSRVALPVVFVKVACLLAIFVLGAQEQYVRQGLILMPSLFVEALFIIGLIRYVLYREPIRIWGKIVPAPTLSIKPIPYHGSLTQKQAIQGALAMYLLLKVVGNGLSAWVLDNMMHADMSAAAAEADPLPPLLGALIMFGTLISFMWLFRLFWLYIPIAMGCRPSLFLKKIAGLRSSIYMIATWLICFLPLMTLFIMLIQFFSGLFIEGSATHIIIDSLLKSMAEMVLICVQVIAMTSGFVDILSQKKSPS